MRKVNYSTSEERDILIQQAQSSGEFLIEDAILLDEKYLIFDSKPLQSQPQPPSLEDRLKAIEDALLSML